MFEHTSLRVISHNVYVYNLLSFPVSEDIPAGFLLMRLNLEDSQHEANGILFFLFDFLPPEAISLHHLL